MPPPYSIDITADVQTNPRYDDLFAAYHPAIRERFAQSYGRRKHEWQREGAKAVAGQEHAAGRFREAAYNRLWDIQRKKLFDLQCRWRADQLNLPGIDGTPDFHILDGTIENCPLLDPISPDEQLLTYLPLVYDDYLLRQQLGIAHPLAAEPHRRDTRLYEGQREDLLDGRALLGEPRTFDF